MQPNKSKRNTVNLDNILIQLDSFKQEDPEVKVNRKQSYRQSIFEIDSLINSLAPPVIPLNDRISRLESLMKSTSQPTVRRAIPNVSRSFSINDKDKLKNVSLIKNIIFSVLFLNQTVVLNVPITECGQYIVDYLNNLSDNPEKVVVALKTIDGNCLNLKDSILLFIDPTISCEFTGLTAVLDSENELFDSLLAETTNWFVDANVEFLTRDDIGWSWKVGKIIATYSGGLECEFDSTRFRISDNLVRPLTCNRVSSNPCIGTRVEVFNEGLQCWYGGVVKASTDDTLVVSRNNGSPDSDNDSNLKVGSLKWRLRGWSHQSRNEDVDSSVDFKSVKVGWHLQLANKIVY